MLQSKEYFYFILFLASLGTVGGTLSSAASMVSLTHDLPHRDVMPLSPSRLRSFWRLSALLI